jgi:thiol-disulfide isomerase/thioredoxin
VRLDSEGADDELVAYVKFRYLTADYGEQLRQDNPDYVKIQETWLANLEKFVADHDKSPDTAEAMLKLAMAEEFAGKENQAKEWYGLILSQFKDSPSARKAEGAARRLNSVGKAIPLKARAVNINGNPEIDITRYRGKVVLIHYWATWCEPCKQDLEVLRELQAQHGRQFTPIGISLDSNPQELRAYLQSNRIGWPQLFEEGGLDSRLANEMGILSLPTMILIDQQGRVVNRSIHASQLQSELEKLLR